MTKPARFKQAEISRAVKAAKENGCGIASWRRGYAADCKSGVDPNDINGPGLKHFPPGA